MTTPNSVVEQPPQDTVSKDEALTKEALELKKLQLEIKELQRPFWKRPAYVLAALPTLLAAITLSVGFINGYFSSQLTKLENQRHDVEVQIKEFEIKREELKNEVENARIEGRNLQEYIKWKEGSLKLCETELEICIKQRRELRGANNK